MKKIIILLVGALALFLVYDKKEVPTEAVMNNNEFREMRGVFVSYIDLKKYIKNVDAEVSKENVRKMLDNIKTFGFNTVILQVRSFSDAIYESSLFPWSEVISSAEGVSPGYDVLDYFLKEGGVRNLEIYAWINPYRVRGDEDSSDISSLNPAYPYLNTDNLYVGKGIFYNPSKSETLEIIKKGVLEIVKKYPVKGILFDDYFYPSDDCDVVDYEEYLKSNSYVDMDSYHFMVINKMVSEVHNICLQYNIPFGISPDGNMENNYNKNFADVKKWLLEGYVDFIMPQIYYGFYNESKPFVPTLKEWHDLVGDKVKFYVALAFYKVGLDDKYARSGRGEWLSSDNVIMREIIVSRSFSKTQGFSLFRYGNLFDEELYTDMTIKEKENIKKIVN